MTLRRRTPLRSTRRWTATETGSRPHRAGGDAWQRLRQACRSRAMSYCQAGIPGVCEGETDDGSFQPIADGHAHHLLRRSQGGPDDLDNLAWLCGFCHGYVHERISWAQSVGLLRSRYASPPWPWHPDDLVTAWKAHL